MLESSYYYCVQSSLAGACDRIVPIEILLRVQCKIRFGNLPRCSAKSGDGGSESRGVLLVTRSTGCCVIEMRGFGGWRMVQTSESDGSHFFEKSAKSGVGVWRAVRW